MNISRLTGREAQRIDLGRLLQHVAVSDCAAIGVPDGCGEEQVKTCAKTVACRYKNWMSFVRKE